MTGTVAQCRVDTGAWAVCTGVSFWRSSDIGYRASKCVESILANNGAIATPWP